MNERRLTPLNEVNDEKISFLWPDRIPLNAITLLDGDPAKGKSTISYDIAARTTTGRAMPNCESSAVAPSGVILLGAEDSLGGTVKPNLLAADADLGKIVVFDRKLFLKDPFVLPDDIDIIETAIAKVQAKLVIIDPLTAFLGGNSNNDQSVRLTFGPLATLAEQTGVSILILRHLRKCGGKNAIYGGAGSIAIAAAARSVLLVGDDPDTDDKHQHILALSKSNLTDATSLSYRTVRHDDATITIKWLGTSKHTANDLAAAKAAREERTALYEAMYIIYSLLIEGPVPATEASRIAARAGVSKRTLARAKAKLGIKSKRRCSGLGSYWIWEPPEDQELVRRFKEIDIADLMNDLCHGSDDPPFSGDDRKFGGDKMNLSDDDNDDEDDDEDEDDGDEWKFGGGKMNLSDDDEDDGVARK